MPDCCAWRACPRPVPPQPIRAARSPDGAGVVTAAAAYLALSYFSRRRLATGWARSTNSLAETRP
jgi:hypothetical protein